MPVAAFQNHTPAIEIKSVAITDFKGAKAKTLFDLMDDFAVLLEPNENLVKIGRFGRPKFWRSNVRFEFKLFGVITGRNEGFKWLTNIMTLQRLNLRLDFAGIGHAIEKNVHHKIAARSCVDCHPFDELRRNGLQVNRPIDARKDPIIGQALGTI